MSNKKSFTIDLLRLLSLVRSTIGMSDVFFDGLYKEDREKLARSLDSQIKRAFGDDKQNLEEGLH